MATAQGFVKQKGKFYVDLDEGTEKKSRWTKEEDERMLALVQKFGRRWTVICSFLPGRSDNAVKNRYHTFFRPIEESSNTKMSLISLEGPHPSNPCILTPTPRPAQISTMPDAVCQGEGQGDDDNDDANYCDNDDDNEMMDHNDDHHEMHNPCADMEITDETPRMPADCDFDDQAQGHASSSQFMAAHPASFSSQQPQQVKNQDVQSRFSRASHHFESEKHLHVSQQNRVFPEHRISLPPFQDLVAGLVQHHVLPPCHEDEDINWLRDHLDEAKCL